MRRTFGTLALACGFITMCIWLQWQRNLGRLPTWCNLTSLPESEQALIEFLILLPLAAFVCAVVRNVFGFITFGTFAPALLGLSFREADSVVGLFILLIVLTVGWMLRRAIAPLHLLQVPRSAVMLSLVAMLLIGFVIWSNQQGRPVASALPFLPLVIVTGLVERFWTTEEEASTAQAVRTMLITLVVAGVIYAMTVWPVIRRLAREQPEWLLCITACQLMLGRYTGYRISELYRFRLLAFRV